MCMIRPAPEVRLLFVTSGSRVAMFFVGVDPPSADQAFRCIRMSMDDRRAEGLAAQAGILQTHSSVVGWEGSLEDPKPSLRRPSLSIFLDFKNAFRLHPNMQRSQHLTAAGTLSSRKELQDTCNRVV